MIAALILYMLADFGLNNRLPFYAEAIEPIYEVIENEPNKLDVLFECYEQETGLPYLYVIANNWLEYNPLYRVSLRERGPIRGYTVRRGLNGRPTGRHPLEIGNLNGDDVVNMIDFAIYAARYKHETWAQNSSKE